MTHSIHHDVFIEAPIERVFEAVTTPSELNRWWTQRCSGTPKLEAEYNLYFTDQYDWWGRVTKCEAPHNFEIQMTQSDPDWDPTRFGFHLSFSNGKTLLSFYHQGWEENNHHFRFSSWCWALLLKALKEYIEQGIVIPFEKRS